MKENPVVGRIQLCVRKQISVCQGYDSRVYARDGKRDSRYGSQRSPSSILSTPGADGFPLRGVPVSRSRRFGAIRRIMVRLRCFRAHDCMRKMNIPSLPRLCPDMTGRRREGAPRT